MAVTASPRFEHRTEHPIVALAAVVRGGSVAALCADGSLSMFAETGTAATDKTRFAPTKAAQDDDVTTRTRLEAHGDGWLAVGPGEHHVTRHLGGRVTRHALGASAVVGFAAAGEQLAVARAGGLELWTFSDTCRWTVEGAFVAVALAGRTVVGIRADGEIVFASQLKGAVTGTLKLGVPEPASGWRLAPLDGNRVALALGEWLVIVDVAAQKVVRRSRARGEVSSFAANDSRLVAGLKDGWVQLFDAFTGEARGAQKVHDGPVAAVAAAGSSLFTAAARGPLALWDQSAIEAAARAGAPVTALGSRGAFVASGDRNGRVRLFAGVEEVASLRLDGPIGATLVRPDDSVVVAAGGVLVCLDKPWKTPRPVLLDEPATALALDATYAFAGTEHGAVHVYDVARGVSVTQYELSEAAISALVRLPGALLVVGTGALDGRVFVVDVAQAKVVHRIDAHQEAFGCTSLACEPRGRLFASGSDDGTVALVDPAKGRVLARVRLTETPVSLAFDPTGRKLAAVLANGTAVVVSLDQKAAVTTLDVPHAARVTWSDALVIGLTDGRLERASFGAPPAKAPVAPRAR